MVAGRKCLGSFADDVAAESRVMVVVVMNGGKLRIEYLGGGDEELGECDAEGGFICRGMSA